MAKTGRSGKRFISYLLIWTAAAMFFPAGAQGDYKSVVADQVTAAFGHFAELYGKRDIQGMMSLFADDPAIVAIGLSGKQVAVGPEAVKSLFEKDLSAMGGRIKLPFDIVAVDNLGLTAWLTANVYPSAEMDNGHIVKGVPGRMTLVMRKLRGQWQIFQVHFSIPSDTGSSFGENQLAGKKAP